MLGLEKPVKKTIPWVCWTCFVLQASDQADAQMFLQFISMWLPHSSIETSVYIFYPQNSRKWNRIKTNSLVLDSLSQLLWDGSIQSEDSKLSKDGDWFKHLYTQSSKQKQIQQVVRLMSSMRILDDFCLIALQQYEPQLGFAHNNHEPDTWNTILYWFNKAQQPFDRSWRSFCCYLLSQRAVREK